MDGDRAERSHLFGRLDPAHPATNSVLQTLAETIRDIPAHRLHAPDSTVWGQAGLLAGQFLRLRASSGRERPERAVLNEALIYLQARWLGGSVLTANLTDFGGLNQRDPEAHVIFYRRPDRRAA